MRLKNKQERENYFNSSNNWILEDRMIGYKIQLKKLSGYPIAELTWILDITPYEFRQGIPIEHRLGYFKINPNWSLNECYSMSFNQCIDFMTKCDKEGK